MGAECRRRVTSITCRNRRLPAFHRCRHRLCARHAQGAGRARRARRPRVDVADGETALRKSCRTRDDPGIHLLFSDAVSVLLGQSTRHANSRGRRRLHAGSAHRRCAPPGALPRVRGELIDDCALGRLLKTQGPIWLGLTDRAQSHRAFRSIARHSSHDQPFGLRAVGLFAVAAGGHRCWRWRWCFWRRRCWRSAASGIDAVACRIGVGADGAGPATDASLLRRLAMVGRRAASDCSHVPRIHAGLCLAALAWQGRHVEGACAYSGSDRR